MDLNLPPNYTYYHVSNKEEEKSFLVKEVMDEESAKVWINNFSDMNLITWRVHKTYPKIKKYIFRKDFRCQHSTDKRCVGKRSSKNTDCPAKLIVKIDRPGEDSDEDVPEIDNYFPACISIVKKHNHEVISPDSLKYRDMSEETRSKLCTLFSQGHGPTSALHCLKTNLLFEHGDDFSKIAADGAYLPSMSKIYNLFEKVFKKTYGDSQLDTGALDKFMTEYNNAGGIGIFQRTADSEHYYVILISPIMLRAHTSIKQTSELVLLDACGGTDKHRRRLYAFVTPTAAGGLPLGFIISGSEEEKVFCEALMCFRNALSGRGFFLNSYPSIIMTDNDMKDAIKEVFPETTVLLSQFHLLKAMWSWLCDKKHDIDAGHRQELYYLFKDIVYSYTEEEALEKVSFFVQRSHELNYFKLLEHFQWLWSFRNDWVCWYRKDLVICDNNTTKYAEVIFRILKDLILNRVLAYSLIQMLDYLGTRYELYLKQRLIDFANGRYKKSLLVKMQPRKRSKENFTIGCTDTGVFTVQEGDEKFTVDLQRGICSCSLGESGRSCAHASATLREVDYSSTSFNVLNKSTKALMLYVATGEEGDVEAIESGHFEHDVHSDETAQESTCEPVESERWEKQYLISAEEFKEFENLIQRIKTGLEKDPSSFVPAFKKMLSNIRRTASTDSGLVSAMHTFGLYTGVQSGKRGKAKQLTRRRRKTVMGVQ